MRMWKTGGFESKKILGILLISLGGLSKICAQNVTPEEDRDILNEQGKILQYQKSLEDYTTQKNQEAYKKPQTFLDRTVLPLNPSLEKGPRTVTDNKPTFFIQTIHVKNVTKLSKSLIKKTIMPYEGKNLTLSDIVILAKALTNEYLKKGYVSSRITVPEQQLKSGILELVAVEGKVDAIIMVKNETELQDALSKKPSFSLKKKQLFPWLEGSVLQLRDLEQGIDQMNRLRSQDGDMTILASDKEGYSTIVIKTNETPKKSWATLQVDTGAFGANDFRPGTGFVVEDVLNLNESWFLNYSDEGRYKASSSQSRIASVTVPWGYWTMSGQYSKSAYLNRVQSRIRLINNTGQTESYVVGLDRVIWRGAHSRMSVALQYSGLEVVSKVEDVDNEASSFKLSVLRASLNHSYLTPIGSFSASVGYHRGLSLSGASRDVSGLAVDEPHAQFSKYMFSGSFYRPSIVLNWPVSFRSSMQLQYAKYSLYSSERMGIGGIFSVRGTSESLSGERGVLIRNDIGLALGDIWKKPVIRNHRIGMSMDSGYTWTRDMYSTYTKGGAVGAGVTLSGRRNTVFWGASYSRPIWVSSFLEKGRGQWSANVGFEF